MEVEANGQLYTGANVVKVSVRGGDLVTKGLGYGTQKGARGEAAFVELPGSRYLFALLDGGPPDSGPQTNAVNIFKDRLPRRGVERYAILSKSRFKTDIPRSHYPLPYEGLPRSHAEGNFYFIMGAEFEDGNIHLLAATVHELMNSGYPAFSH